MSAVSGMVLQSHSEAADLCRNWFALSTFSNSEKQVEKHLAIRGVETFLPLHTVVKRWKNRQTVKLDRPLFAGYLFVRIAPTERVRVLESPGVVSIVSSGRKLLPLPEEEIETLRKELHLREAEPHPYLKAGTRVRIKSGPLTGMTGVVIRNDKRLRVVISFEMLMRSIAVHVYEDELETCSKANA